MPCKPSPRLFHAYVRLFQKIRPFISIFSFKRLAKNNAFCFFDLIVALFSYDCSRYRFCCRHAFSVPVPCYLLCHHARKSK